MLQRNRPQLWGKRHSMQRRRLLQPLHMVSHSMPHHSSKRLSSQLTARLLSKLQPLLTVSHSRPHLSTRHRLNSRSRAMRLMISMTTFRSEKLAA